VLLPIEEAILTEGLHRVRAGDPEFHGFALAEGLGEGGLDARLLGHGTLYKALARLEHGGLLESRWEEIDPVIAGRPRRRLYRVTGAAAGAIAASRALTTETGSTAAWT
jgi:PadR family transcriptional regulator, regulatory protein PadR